MSLQAVSGLEGNSPCILITRSHYSFSDYLGH